MDGLDGLEPKMCFVMPPAVRTESLDATMAHRTSARRLESSQPSHPTNGSDYARGSYASIGGSGDGLDGWTLARQAVETKAKVPSQSTGCSRLQSFVSNSTRPGAILVCCAATRAQFVRAEALPVKYAPRRRGGTVGKPRSRTRGRPLLLAGGFPHSPAVQDRLSEPIDGTVTPLGGDFQGPLCLASDPKRQARILLHRSVYQPLALPMQCE